MKESEYLSEMYQDSYYPDFLVDKIKAALKEVAAILENGETNITVVQAALDKAVLAINDLVEEFEDNDSELETVARESIAVTVQKMLESYHINIDLEEALRERDW
ncbi:hypothetical protein JZO70_20530 [Enterococcus sp. 669A]|uniref:Uncharacterized protein n=1 Tax=Candidatus Enterococcus moelleringii TaxID=2815325 RepID=A0ABS3LFZ9_9ENTE|nr:DUF5713 family protein [Enterococcus sp. 669A]MBO1308573.1 hypothetical protein [Enterococcus sp. 669A]